MRPLYFTDQDGIILMTSMVIQNSFGKYRPCYHNAMFQQRNCLISPIFIPLKIIYMPIYTYTCDFLITDGFLNFLQWMIIQKGVETPQTCPFLLPEEHLLSLMLYYTLIIVLKEELSFMNLCKKYFSNNYARHAFNTNIHVYIHKYWKSNNEY